MVLTLLVKSSAALTEVSGDTDLGYVKTWQHENEKCLWMVTHTQFSITESELKSCSPSAPLQGTQQPGFLKNHNNVIQRDRG